MKQFLERLGRFVQRWHTYRQVRAELDTYSDRELQDIGMSRADIDRIAREAAGFTKAAGRYGQDPYPVTRASHV